MYIIKYKNKFYNNYRYSKSIQKAQVYETKSEARIVVDNEVFGTYDTTPSNFNINDYKIVKVRIQEVK
jgi:hypothetical protein